MGKLINFSDSKNNADLAEDCAKHFGLSSAPFSAGAADEDGSPRDLDKELGSALAVPGLILITSADGKASVGLNSLVQKHLDDDRALASFSALPTRPEQLLAGILHDFGFDSIDADLAECRSVMEAFLMHNARVERYPVIVVPEAEQLDMLLLDELARLLRLQENKLPCLHLILEGSPEFLREAQVHFADVDFSHIELDTVEKTDVADYVFTKLQAAGLEGRSLFTPAAIRHVAEVSAGLPVNINRVCNQALHYAFENEEKKITKRTLLESLAQVESADEPKSVTAAAEIILESREANTKFRSHRPYFELSRDGKHIAHFELKGGKLTIGRHKSNDIYIPSPGVSLFHTIIVAEDRDVFVFDLRSTNGTCLNGRDVRSKKLSKGDRISFGSVSLQFFPGEGTASDIPSGANVLHFAETVVLEDSDTSDPTVYIKTSL